MRRRLHDRARTVRGPARRPSQPARGRSGRGREPRRQSDEFDALFEEVSNWGRWGDDDERGTLNLLTPAAVVAAAGLVRTGETVTLSLPLDTRPAPITRSLRSTG